MALNQDGVRNRLHWDKISDEYQAAHGDQLGRNPLAWGVWSIPEDELHILGDFRGKDVLEFGCGAAQWSIALAKRGARCVGLDNSARQLEHARENQRIAGIEFRLIHASAESVPLPDASFDIIFCDHGAMTFADPLRNGSRSRAPAPCLKPEPRSERFEGRMGERTAIGILKFQERTG